MSVVASDNLMQQHDRLYQQAYREYLNDHLENARQLAAEAVSRAEKFFLNPAFPLPSASFTCRALKLLRAIDERSLASRGQ